jgi:hypothetical protein
MFTPCPCPAATTLKTIPEEGCSQRFGQIQKLIFQRLTSGGVRNGIADGTSVGEAGLLASWTALKSATDGTKIVVSPFIENPTDDGGDAKTVGGGNESLNGIARVIGSNPINFSCKLNNKKQDIIAALKALICEAQGQNLGVYLVNENGQIKGVMETVSGTPDVTTWYPIPIQSLFVSDLHHGGLEADDYNDMSFGFAPGYSDKTDILTLDASALAL